MNKKKLNSSKRKILFKRKKEHVITIKLDTILKVLFGGSFILSLIIIIQNRGFYFNFSIFKIITYLFFLDLLLYLLLIYFVIIIIFEGFSISTKYKGGMISNSKKLKK